MKKTFKVIAILFLLVFMVSCKNNNNKKKDPTLVPNLVDKNKEEIETLFASYEEEVNLEFTYVYSNDVEYNYFIKYETPTVVGEELKKGDEITVVLASNKYNLENLSNKTETEITERFEAVKSEYEGLEFSFSFKYVESAVDEGLFVGFEEPFKVGDPIKINDSVVVLLSQDKFVLPSLNGKNKTEIEAVFTQLLNKYPSLDLKLEFVDVYDDKLALGEFISYKSHKEGDKINASTTIVINIATYVTIPNLTGKTKAEIIDIFEALLNDYEDVSVNLEFVETYNDKLVNDEFVSFKTHKIGDRITNDLVITINVAHNKTLPDLTGMSKSQIEAEFIELLSETENHGVEIEFIYYYPKENNQEMFVSYGKDFSAGQLIKQNSLIVIGIVGEYAIYPNVSNKSEAEINLLFENIFKDYVDVSYELTYKDYYDATANEGTIISYAKDIEIGSQILSVDEFYLVKTFKMLILPDLRGLQVFEMKDLFAELNIPLSRIFFLPDYSEFVNAGEFIKYDEGYRRGESFDISKKYLSIFYDLREVLPNLSGLNQKQIEEILNPLGVDFSFSYVLDNTQEYDTFANYKDYEPGDEIFSNMKLVVNLFKNDDVNIGEYVANEYELFISKYIDSGLYNQGIELYNPTDKDINLEDYYIAILPGGAYLPREIIYLSGTLKSKETYLIVHTAADTKMLNASNMQTSLMSFGASAAIQLRKSYNDSYIDSIYDVGNISVLMDREIFVRREHITSGRRDYSYMEWMGFAQGFYDLLGIHPYVGDFAPVFELITDKTFQEYGMTKVKFLYENDGDTANFESLDPRDTSSYSGDQRVRFLMVDTPEIGEPYKQEAQNFTRNLLLSASEIYLQASPSGIIETYGRHLAYIWANIGTPEKPNWKFVNYELLKAGLAEIGIARTGKYYDEPIYSNRYLYSWAIDADNYAKANNLGLYSGIYKP